MNSENKEADIEVTSEIASETVSEPSSEKRDLYSADVIIGSKDSNVVFYRECSSQRDKEGAESSRILDEKLEGLQEEDAISVATSAMHLILEKRMLIVGAMILIALLMLGAIIWLFTFRSVLANLDVYLDAASKLDVAFEELFRGGI